MITGDSISHSNTGKSGTGTGMLEGQQSATAKQNSCSLATNLMEKVVNRSNLNQAYRRVKANKGSPGIDGMTVNDFLEVSSDDKEQLIQSLLDGSYQPQPVRKVMIPKPGGGERQLGIPTVTDRIVQQAILQVMEPIFDPEFSSSSFGFRPRRGAHGALKQAKHYVEGGHTWVVDMDLEKFFDRVNHDILMSRLARKIEDKRLLKIIRRFLTAGIMQEGIVMRRYEGTPQGGPLSPLLSNILLDELDKELERRGHKFCRYADDQNIYVRSKRAGERVYQSIKRFLAIKLKLKVNDAKSAVAQVGDRQFLGYRLNNDGRLTVAPTSIDRAKDKIRSLSWRSCGKSLTQVLTALNTFLRGWFNYYHLAEDNHLWQQLDGWIRRRLRCFKLKQKKRGASIWKLLMSLGVPEIPARKVSSSGKGWWRLARTRPVHQALNNVWFERQGLISLKRQWELLLNT